jgi:hypothetical protein
MSPKRSLSGMKKSRLFKLICRGASGNIEAEGKPKGAF